LPLHTRRRVIEAVLNEILVLRNKPKAVVHSVHKLKKEGGGEEGEEGGGREEGEGGGGGGGEEEEEVCIIYFILYFSLYPTHVSLEN